MATLQEILIIDAIEDHIKMIYDFLSEQFVLHSCTSIQSAQEILSNNNITLVICSEKLSDGTGINCIDILNKKHPNMAYILIMESSDFQKVVEAINNGIPIDKFIQWPCTEIQLNSLVTNVLINKIERSMEEKDRMIAIIEQREKLANLGELVSGVAHEINNPLTFINSNMSNLKKFTQKIFDFIQNISEMDLPDSTKKLIKAEKENMNYDYIHQRIQNLLDRSLLGTDRMKKILMDIKTFSRMAGTEKAYADINDAIEITVDLINFQFKDNIKIETIYGLIPEIECNIEKLNQVFMNIIINAIHAIELEGVIKIETNEENGKVIIQITDNGKGIPEDVIPNIFNTFFTTKEKGKGTGLGLSICRNIIQQHQGNIDVHSKVGQGTTFTITLPIYS
ncbi:ATP-binding region, ATPase-like domain protein [Candidatus Magnetomorum sp. HK-1]|nr:ATP-binding region, ATPase-like domain protein [Candidatus Magnetomorum sp. HK-1]